MAKLKTKYKYIEFKESIFLKIWTCMNRKDKTELGTVEFEALWNQYVFCTNNEIYVMFSAGCLRDIAHFIKQLNADDGTTSKSKEY